MIFYNYETDFNLENESLLSDWIFSIVKEYNATLGEVNYIFCDDEYLLDLNQKYLNHNTLTDIISFDYSIGNLINGDIFISIERVKENAVTYNVSFEEELYRVMIHGILHYVGFKDKFDKDKSVMRNAENSALSFLKNNYLE